MKTEEEMIKLVSSAIEDSMDSKLTKENPKLDLKSSWYNLKSSVGIMEFVKDTSSIANTMGLDGYIIIGYDDTQKKYTNAKFSDSGLKDNHELNFVIIKHVSSSFTLHHIDVVVAGHSFSILHIPPSLDKPHCIKMYRTYEKDGKPKGEYENRIFVKRNSSTAVASRYDIDIMYYDRKNLEPDYLAYIYLTDCSREDAYVRLSLVIENVGRRSLAIKDLKILINNPFGEGMYFLKTSYYKIKPTNYIMSRANLVINPYQIAAYEWVCFGNEKGNQLPNQEVEKLVNKIKQSETISIEFTLANGKTFNETIVVNL